MSHGIGIILIPWSVNHISWLKYQGTGIRIESPAAAIVETGSRAISSDRNIFDGSFLRLKNINLGYNFELSGNKNLRVYLSAQNLFVWTDYPGYDPEVRTYTKNPQKRGVDFGTYPGTKSYLIGLKFNY